ncbi:helix-turn-helix transcriptional regulator [Streptomyces phaeochromogenes]|uniref:helix-turn-helix transcriptional regulator n=1 Tax=Streptomyces phaeochromogenes TaxID=1923 RepID=UPI0006E3F680|nr:helix-turn-helix transcriptional regulator [Streptomyces phaeochromogenes]
MFTNSLGLHPDEESAYRAMLTNPHMSVPELAAHLGWPTGRVATAIDRLARRSLVQLLPESPGRPVLVRPELALAALLLDEEAALLDHRRRVAASSTAVTQVIAAYNAPEDRPDVVRLPGPEAIQDRIDQFATACEVEIAALEVNDSRSAERLEAAERLDTTMLARGVDVRRVYPDGARHDTATVRYADRLTARGGQVRTARRLPPQVIVFDRYSAIVPIDPAQPNAEAVAIQGTGAVTALLTLFDHVWEQATPLGSAADEADEFTDQEHTLLELLCAGNTDEVIARRLGVSVRTGRRLTSGLMNRLGARSRFQAGVLAAARGWVLPPDAEDGAPLTTAEPKVSR